MSAPTASILQSSPPGSAGVLGDYYIGKLALRTILISDNYYAFTFVSGVAPSHLISHRHASAFMTKMQHKVQNFSSGNCKLLYSWYAYMVGDISCCYPGIVTKVCSRGIGIERCIFIMVCLEFALRCNVSSS